MSNEILSTPQGGTIKLGDRELRLSPLNLNVMANIEEEFDCSLREVSKLLVGKDARPLSALRKLLRIFLQEHQPGITLEDIGKLVTRENLSAVTEIVAKGLKGA